MAKLRQQNPADKKLRDRQEIERLRETHELYEDYKPDWEFYLSAYDGGEDFACPENIFKHVREHPADFKERAKRVYNENYCSPLVDFFTDFIFQETIQRNGGKNREFYNDFITDVNRKGDNASTFMKEVCDDMQIFGHAFAIADAPRLKRTLTRRQEKELKIRPYWMLIRPLEILDWVVDEFENFIYVKRYQRVTELAGTSKVKLDRYTEYYTHQVVVTDVDVTRKDEPVILRKEVVANPLSEIPIVMFRFKKSKTNRFMGNSFLRDLAGANREFINLLSLEQEFLYRQCYNILAMEAETGLPIQDQQEGEQGQSNVIEVPKGAKFPAYVAPSAEPASAIANRMVRVVNYMFWFAAQDMMNDLFNGQKSSGFSQSVSFSKSVPKIATRAEVLQDGENKLMRLTMKYIGEEWDGKVAYKDRYEITNLTDALTQLLQIFRDMVMPSPTFAKQELKRMVSEYDGKIPSDELIKIEREIDEVIDKNFKEWQDKVLQTKQQSPSDQNKSKQSGTMAEAKAEASKGQSNDATNKMRSKKNAA